MDFPSLSRLLEKCSTEIKSLDEKLDVTNVLNDKMDIVIKGQNKMEKKLEDANKSQKTVELKLENMNLDNAAKEIKSYSETLKKNLKPPGNLNLKEPIWKALMSIKQDDERSKNIIIHGIDLNPTNTDPIKDIEQQVTNIISEVGSDYDFDKMKIEVLGKIIQDGSVGYKIDNTGNRKSTVCKSETQ